jgi:hypothetical protein
MRESIEVQLLLKFSSYAPNAIQDSTLCANLRDKVSAINPPLREVQRAPEVIQLLSRPDGKMWQVSEMARV